MVIKEKIRFCINNWDPIGLMAICPPDEYEPEIRDIYKKFIEQKQDKLLLGKIIFDIFKYYFGDTFIKSYDECNKIAALILQ